MLAEVHEEMVIMLFLIEKWGYGPSHALLLFWNRV
jgi:hypothetical protein